MSTSHDGKDRKLASGARESSRFTSDLPRPSIALGRNGILLLIGTLTTLSIAARLAPVELDELDHRVGEWLGSPRYLWFFRSVSQLGSTELTLALSGVVSVAVWRRCRPLAIVYPAAVTAGLLVNVVLKEAIDRARPPDSLTRTALASFPSGHTIQATVALGMLPPVVYVLTKRRPAVVATAVVAAVGTAAVGLSRVVLGAHWVSDVAGGVLVGVLVILGAETALERFPGKWMSNCSECPMHRSWDDARDQ